ncbi:hypothetical protein EGR_07969 [Echinococcus granulosus]|uniref:Uncharacterized protein n=1 Tax=Echinococcus granulosus TaxID=6210 RepID=W6UG80_ECHGR|nr:hypothetical protein EGR_07969 [Echinococcus granulosus]EUB57152.1 hypothetical protein EGR_07969 [Echinococcus granulosus]
MSVHKTMSTGYPFTLIEIDVLASGITCSKNNLLTLAVKPNPCVNDKVDGEANQPSTQSVHLTLHRVCLTHGCFVPMTHSFVLKNDGNGDDVQAQLNYKFHQSFQCCKK